MKLRHACSPFCCRGHAAELPILGCPWPAAAPSLFALPASLLQVFELTAELAAARRTAEAAQEEARQARAAGQQALAALQYVMSPGAPQPQHTALLGPVLQMLCPARLTAQQVQQGQQAGVPTYANSLIVQQVPPRLQLPTQHRPAGLPPQPPSPRYASMHGQPPSPQAAQPLLSQPPSPRTGPPQPWQPASPHSAQPPSPRSAQPPFLQAQQPGGQGLPGNVQWSPPKLQQAPVLPQPPLGAARLPVPLHPAGQAQSPRAIAPASQPAASPPLSPHAGPAAGLQTAFTAPQSQPPLIVPAVAPASSPAGGRPPLLPAQPVRPVALPPGPHSPLQRLLQQHQERQWTAGQQGLPQQATTQPVQDLPAQPTAQLAPAGPQAETAAQPAAGQAPVAPPAASWPVPKSEPADPSQQAS